MRRVLDMQTSARSLDQFQKNIATQKEVSASTFNVMKSLKKLSDRAGEIATLADGLKSREQLNIYATEIGEMLKQGVQAANATFKGDYLLGGTASSTPPFVATKDASGAITGVAYQGNSGLPQSEIADNVVTSAHTLGGNTSGSGPQGLITDSRTGADFFKQIKSADNIGLDKVFRAMDRSINMAFSGEVEHCARLVFGQQTGYQGAVANVAVHKEMPRVAIQRRKRFQIACVGQLVEVDDGLVGLGQPVKDKVCANEAGCAGDENSHF